jgi:hypothetical protein
VRRKPGRVGALQVPTPMLGSPAPAGRRAAPLMRAAHPPRRVAKLMRRLLVAGGLLICGWLLGSLQSAHAADVAPPPAASAGHAADAVRAVTTHTAATRARDDQVSTAGVHSRPHSRHAATAAYRASARPTGADVTRSATPSAHARPGNAVHGIPTGTRQAVRQTPAATGTISRGAHARPSTRTVDSAAPRGAGASRLAGPPVSALVPVSALAPTLAQRAAPAPATPSHTPAASDLATALNSSALGPAAAPSVPPPAPELLPALRPAAAPPHPPPVLGRSQAFGPLPELHALLELGPTAALRGSTALAPLPAILAELARPPGPLGDTTGIPGPATALVTGPTGVLTGVLTGPLDSAAAGLDPLPVFDDLMALPGSVTDAVGSVPSIIQRPIDAIGAVAALATTTLGTTALGALTAPLHGVLGQLGRLSTGLLSQVAGLLEPAARLLEPIDRFGLTGGLVGDTPIGSPLPPPVSPAAACRAGEPSSIGGSWPAVVVPAGSGHIGTGGSGEQQIALVPVTPADQPLGAGLHDSATRVLCGQWPQPPRSPDVARTHMSGQATGPFSPGAPNVPLSGGSNRALPTSSHNDGSCDTPHSWRARVPEAFVPARIVVSPAVRTAADEPAFSPD